METDDRKEFALSFFTQLMRGEGEDGEHLKSSPELEGKFLEEFKEVFACFMEVSMQNLIEARLREIVAKKGLASAIVVEIPLLIAAAAGIGAVIGGTENLE